ncbi:phosphatase PAP2 family protein [Nocardiopsis sp. FIRDI 009]|uniref:phosphatase PAP2 family protein n=1 Tax=Nocardiopsis sp. FIRDI 009 TaxID=714197 RepID=UPI000E246EEB|nr:phosphatase PAP2 family protein [Nocardiopsis sp. FIRDI 009]
MTTTTPPRGIADRAARIITEVCAPGILVVAVLLAIGWYAAPGPAGLGWGVLAALFCGVVPYGLLIVGARLGWWTDHHVRDRGQRLVPLLIIIGCVVSGVATLLALDAPTAMLALVVAMLATLFVTLAVTVAARWKISVHTAVAGGSAVLLALTYGSLPVVTVPVVALVGWSRVRLGDHTPAQTLAGAALGATVAGCVFQWVG